MVKNIMMADGKYLINLHDIDNEIAEQTAEENAGRTVPPERGRLLADYILTILRSFEKVTTSDNFISAFEQVGIRSKLTDRTNMDSRVTYTDPATARVVVEDFGVIALPAEFQVEPAPTWQLKITELISGHQTPMARQLHLELDAICAELAPPPEQPSVTTPNSPTGSEEELPVAALPPELPVIPARCCTRPPASSCSGRRSRPSSLRSPLCVPQSRLSHYTHSHSGVGYQVLPGSGDSPQTRGPGPF